ncbi:hypothetical protein [Amycolatopsis sp. FDAARGOS 1241]|uniref:hypothetical protein n=1 Tax=Amycolatopsis sp. FDAARGOS 1241 TaxID=2778070 RepID=UPI0019520F14|nr:hypothetical protein [Amycolatopsis sp. FDAARGOS 1241]QRP48089.1 hypothetical protein I6J71_09500 [Amycolatopsis sp. FDAARGOS 1241]
MAEQVARGAEQVRALGATTFVVSDGAGGSTSGTSASGGFYLSRDAMTAELANLKQLQDRITSQVRKALPMWSIQSPGQDPASLRNTVASNNSGNLYHDHLIRQGEYLGVIIAKMESALGMHQANDEQARQAINAQGSGSHF